MLSNAEKILALMDRDRGAADGDFAQNYAARAHVEEERETRAQGEKEGDSIGSGRGANIHAPATHGLLGEERAEVRAAFKCKGAFQRAASATGLLSGYLDSGASHNQMKSAAMRELGQGFTKATSTTIYGVNENAPLRSTHKGEALWPLAHDTDGTTHAVKLKGVLTGGDVSGPALLSIGRLTEEGYWFLIGRTGSNSYCWIFDKTMTFVKAVKRQDFVYPVNASDHDQTGVGRNYR